jgi:hypothetical protein
MFLVFWLFGISWIAFAVIMLFWPFVKVNELIVLLIDRKLGREAIGRKIAFTQFFALAALILGIGAIATLFASMTWNLSAVFGSSAIVCQVLSLKFVPYLSKLLGEDNYE